MKDILLLSDLHVGSLWGLWPPDFEADDPRGDNRLKFVQNHTQKQLWKHWKTMADKVKPEIIIFNGDLIDGQQRRSVGREVVTSRIEMQVAACTDIIRTLPEAPMYFTQGTDYHEMPDGSAAEYYIAKELGGEFGDDLLIDECGIRMHVGHAISTSQSSWQYWTTALARDLLLLALHSADQKYGHVDVAVRSHRHNFCGAIFKNQIGVITPAWQTRTPYAVKKDLVSPPDIGYVQLHVEDKKNIMINRAGIISTPVKPSRIVGRDRIKQKPNRQTEGLK